MFPCSNVFLVLQQSSYPVPILSSSSFPSFPGIELGEYPPLHWALSLCSLALYKFGTIIQHGTASIQSYIPLIEDTNIFNTMIKNDEEW